MKPISEGIYGLLVSQGIANGRAGTRASGGNKGRGAASDGAHSRVKADAGEEKPHRPIGPHTGGGRRDQSGMGVKGTLAETSAEFTGGQTRSERSQGGPVLRVYTNPNALKASTRKGAKTTLFLVVA